MTTSKPFQTGTDTGLPILQNPIASNNPDPAFSLEGGVPQAMAGVGGKPLTIEVLNGLFKGLSEYQHFAQSHGFYPYDPELPSIKKGGIFYTTDPTSGVSFHLAKQDFIQGSGVSHPPGGVEDSYWLPVDLSLKDLEQAYRAADTALDARVQQLESDTAVPVLHGFVTDDSITSPSTVPDPVPTDSGSVTQADIDIGDYFELQNSTYPTLHLLIKTATGWSIREVDSKLKDTSIIQTNAGLQNIAGANQHDLNGSIDQQLTAVKGSVSSGDASTLASAKSYTDTKKTEAVSEAATLYLPKAGGTMTGKITLDGAPTANLHAATKAYVDSHVSSASSLPIYGAQVGDRPYSELVNVPQYGTALIRYDSGRRVALYQNFSLLAKNPATDPYHEWYPLEPIAHNGDSFLVFLSRYTVVNIEGQLFIFYGSVGTKNADIIMENLVTRGQYVVPLKISGNHITLNHYGLITNSSHAGYRGWLAHNQWVSKGQFIDYFDSANFYRYVALRDGASSGLEHTDVHVNGLFAHHTYA